MKNKTISRIADSYRPNSLAYLLRKRRHLFFVSLLNQVPSPFRILDVGGTQQYWEGMGLSGLPGVQITIMNLTLEEVNIPNIQAVMGDATSMRRFAENEFDVVFSNSVIEHVGNYSNQQRMADEVKRVGKRYFVQTPNYWFPIDPHFLVVGYQWLPRSVQLSLIKKFNLGWYKKAKDDREAFDLLEHNRLLKFDELRSLFPEAKIYKEKVFGLTKSYIAYFGW